MIKDLGKEGILIDYGPVTAVISVIKNGKNVKNAEIKGLEIVREILEELNRFKEFLKLKAVKLNLKKKNVSATVKKAVNAAMLIDRHELSPLAAIAGAVGESVTSRINAIGDFDRIIMNNGGDISVICKTKDNLPMVSINGIKGTIASTKVKGIATSGLRGRSLTKGIADYVTVFANSASVADAAATLIANNVTLASEKITYEFAENIDKNSDLKGEKVTLSVAPLTETEVNTALQNGLTTANNLMKSNKILSAILGIGNVTYTTSGMENFLRKEI
jgi:ApbE superfamily uncharacterized protein (UPF0280 family)